MINNGDILAVKFCQKFLGQDVCMVWTITTKNPAGAIDLRWLAERIRERINPLLQDVQHQVVTNESITIDNLSNGVDFAQVDWLGTGLNGGDVMPTFVAYKIQLGRTNKITRQGAKRVPGVPENAWANGVVKPDWVAALQLLADFFALPYTYANDAGSVLVQPVIVGRNALGEFDLNRVQNVAFGSVSTQLTTQNTRKTR